jgi:transposase
MTVLSADLGNNLRARIVERWRIKEARESTMKENHRVLLAEGPLLGGVDTHKDIHVAAVLGHTGALLGTAQFPATLRGHNELLGWMRSFGDIGAVGVEGSGNYGAGLTRFLLAQGVRVMEVVRPDRRARRFNGKSDTLDAENAARAVLAGERTSAPKHRDGAVEALRTLRVARTSAVKARRAALQLLRNTIVSAPDRLRECVSSLTRRVLVRTCASWRPNREAVDDPTTATRIALRSLARRILKLEEEIEDLDELIAALVTQINPRLMQAPGVGVEIAAQLLITVGENPERMRNEAAFAMLCGVAPLPASSGKTRRYRLNRGGDRAANCALHMAAISRLRVDPRTRAYVARRTAEGLSKKEILRCLKRYLAREFYKLLKPPPSDLVTSAEIAA